MGTAESPESGNGIRNNKDWIVCKNCGLEYPRSWSRCSVCRTGSSVTKRHGVLIAVIAGVAVAVFFITCAYGYYLTKDNLAAIPDTLSKTTESYSKPTVAVPQTGLFEAEVEDDCVAQFNVTSYDESAPCFIKLIDVSDENNVVTLFVNPGETARIMVPLGSYKMMCASGEIWYGPRYLFGPDTTYTKADKIYEFKKDVSGRVDGWSIDMTPQEEGNLYMDEVSKGQW